MRKSLISPYLLCLLLLYSFSCATTPERPEGGRAPLEAKAVEVAEQEDVEVIEQRRVKSLGRLITRLYEKAYEDYLTGNYENAIVGFEAAEIFHSDKMEFWKKLALNYCYLATGRYKDAEKLSAVLIDEKAEYWGSYLHAGLSALWQGKTKSAIKYLEMADDFEAHEPVVNFYLGMAQQLMNRKNISQEQYAVAEVAYKDIISKNPNEEQSYIELAYLYIYRDIKFQEVPELLARAEEIIKTSDDLEKRQRWLDFYLPHLRGIYLYKTGKYHESIFTLGGAIEKSPTGIRLDLAESYYYLGRNYQALEDGQRAKRFFKKAISLDKLILYAREIRSLLKSKKKKRKKS